jgi:hypothetical protein
MDGPAAPFEGTFVADRAHINRIQACLSQVIGLPPKHLRSVYVYEAFQRATVWEGVVEIFQLSASARCYAWEGLDGEIAMIPEGPEVQNASDAVKQFLQSKRSR